MKKRKLTEEEVFKIFSGRFENFRRRVSTNELLDASVETAVLAVNGKKIYLVGETHLSRRQVDYVHESIIPLMKSDPTTWLIVREGASEYSRIDRSTPNQSQYFHDIADIFGIPYIEAVKDIAEKETIDYILDKTGLSETDIHWFNYSMVMDDYLCHLGENDDETRVQAHRSALRILSIEFKRPLSGFDYLLSKGPIPEALDRLIVSAWNDHIREGFYKILEQYPEKTNVLVSVGKGHMDAFR